MTSNATLEVGTQVRLKDTYLDQACTTPVTGEIKDTIFYNGSLKYVVMFHHQNPSLPFGGEFTADQLLGDPDPDLADEPEMSEKASPKIA